MCENGFEVMTVCEMWPKDVIITVVIATDVEDETTANALIQMVIDSNIRLSDGRTTQAF